MSESTKKSSVQYLYIRDNLRRPLLTVAYTKKADETWVGWAAINLEGHYDEEKDRFVKDRYSKETGRYIAEGRLMKNPAIVVVPVTGDARVDRRMERAMVLRALLREEDDSSPNRRALVPRTAHKYLERRIEALETEKGAVEKVAEVTIKGEPLFTAEIRHDAVYTQNWVNGNGPLPLSWLIKHLREGEWKVVRVK